MIFSFHKLNAKMNQGQNEIVEKPEIEIQSLVHSCNEALKKIFDNERNFSFLENDDKKQTHTTQNTNFVVINNTEVRTINDINQLKDSKLKSVIGSKYISKDLWFVIELADNDIVLITPSVAEKFIDDDTMITFLWNEIDNNKYNPIPQLHKDEIENKIQTSYFSTPNPFVNLKK